MKILIIQNTNYHFETTISLYSSLLRLNPQKLSIVKLVNDYYKQDKFCEKYSISTIDKNDDNIYNYDIAFVISSFPNPYVNLKDSIPSSNHNLFSFYDKKIIYISHRFDKIKDYTIHPKINFQNSISLSKLSLNIGLDYFYPIEYPIQPSVTYNSIYTGCIQGHFELNNRILHEDILKCKNNMLLKILGTCTNKIPKSECYKYYSSLDEISFYKQLNDTKFIFSMIDNKIKNSTYKYQRFSSNFNHAMALEKPIFCHEHFKNIYDVPGIYYNDTNINNKIEEMLNITEYNYLNIIDQFNEIKNKYYEYNNQVLSQKISNIINQ
jgi:hypothetical protein